jgi:hypothetical protein
MEQIHPDLRVLAFESAKYELTEENKLHATLGNIPYTHLTSPLRRYADLVNQRILKAILHKETIPFIPPSLPSSLNEIQRKIKHHDRELFFLEQILQEPTGLLEGLVVESSESKTNLYIPSWKRTVKVVCSQTEPGTKVTVEYYADLRKVSWKERIVFRVKN